MPPHPFYSSIEWKKLRSKVRARWKALGLPCAYCGEKLNYQAMPIVDHIIPRREAPERALDVTNLQVVCHACNTLKAHSKAPVTPTGADGFPPGWDA